MTVEGTLRIKDEMTPVLDNINKKMGKTISAAMRMDEMLSKAFSKTKSDEKMTVAIDQSYNFTFEAGKNDLSEAAKSAEKTKESMEKTSKLSFSKIRADASKMVEDAGKMVKAIAGGIGKAVSGMSKVAELSDKMSRTKTQLSFVDDGLLDNISGIEKAVAQSARRSGKSYLETADAVSKLGMNAKEVFGDMENGVKSAELVGFAELTSKAFKMSAQDPAVQASSMDKFIDAVPSGFNGDQIKGLATEAPEIFSAISKYMEKTEQEMMSLSSTTKITGEDMKNALFAASEGINSKFGELPMTWAGVMESIKTSAITALNPVLAKISEIAQNESVLAFVGMLKNAFDLVAQGLIWVMDQIGVVAAWVQNHIEQIKQGLILLAAVVAVVGAVMLVAWLLSILPILLIIAAIMIVVGILDYFGVTTEQVLSFVCGLFFMLGAMIMNQFIGLLDFIFAFIEGIVNPFISFANFLGNVFTDPVSSIIYLFQGMGDSLLGILEKVAESMDALFGTNLAQMVGGWRVGLKDLADEAVKKYAPDKKYEQYFDKLDLSAEGLGLTRMSGEDAWAKGNDFGGKISGKLDGLGGIEDLTGQFSDLGIGTEVPGYSPPMESDIGAGGGGGMGNIDRVGSVGKIEDEVDISQEDIKLLKDVASMEYQLNYTQMTPQVTANFGDIRETVDAEQFMGIIAQKAESALSSSLVVSG